MFIIVMKQLQWIEFHYQILVNFTEAMEEEQSRQQLQTENPMKRKIDLNMEGILLNQVFKTLCFVESKILNRHTQFMILLIS